MTANASLVRDPSGATGMALDSGATEELWRIL